MTDPSEHGAGWTSLGPREGSLEPCAECGWVATSAAPEHRCAPPKPAKKPIRKKGRTETNSRTLAFCREHGWTVETTEHWNPVVKQKKDLLGFVDQLVLCNGRGPNPIRRGVGTILGIQVTTGGSAKKGRSGESAGNAKARQKKIEANPNSRALLAAGGLIEVWNWKKDEKGRWVVVRHRLVCAIPAIWQEVVSE